jgi:hypothetical protein
MNSTPDEEPALFLVGCSVYAAWRRKSATGGHFEAVASNRGL